MQGVTSTVVFFICLCGLTFFAGLGSPAITDSDEAFYAESAREMVERADWLTPNFNYTARFEKPILYYWMAAATYFVFGASSWAARFPSALAGVGLVLIAYLCARRWYDNATAFLAGVISATSFGAIAMARQALPDLPLAFFVTLATWAALIGLFNPPPGGGVIGVRRMWLITAAVGTAGAFLVKGPVVLPLLAMVLGPICLLEYTLYGTRWRVRAVDVAVACTIFVIIALPWYLAMTLEHGVSYLERFFLTENFDRFATARYNAPRSVWYYLPIVVGGLLPWSLFLPLWVPSLTNAWRQRFVDVRAVRLGVWAFAPLMFYTASIGKQPRYILPILIPLAVLLAHTIVSALRTPENRRGLFVCCSIAAGITIIALGAVVYRARTLFTEWTGSEPLAVGAALAIAGSAILVTALGSRMKARQHWIHAIPALLLTATIVAALGAHYVVLATPGPAPVERMAAMLDAARPHNEPYGRHRVFDRNLVYYVGSPHVELPIIDAVRDFLRSPERVLCVLRSEDAARLKREGLTLREIGSVSYLNTGSLTLRMVLNPDPNRYRQRVVLVTNR